MYLLYLLKMMTKELRMTAFVEACSVLEQHENEETMSILEMALWKSQLKVGWSNAGSKRQGSAEKSADLSVDRTL